MLSTIVAYGSFLLGQSLGMSGVVACVTAAIVLGNLGRAAHHESSDARDVWATVWEYAAFVANSLIFLLIGLQHGPRRHRRPRRSGGWSLFLVVVVGARAVTIYGYELFRRAPSSDAGLPFRWQHVLVWGGLRGTIALALVLSVPAAVGRTRRSSKVGDFRGRPALARRPGAHDAVGSRGASRLKVRSSRRARARRREALLEGFVRAHEELGTACRRPARVPRAERRHVERTIEEQE